MDTNKYIRIPFKDHGRTREGADCWGLTRIIFQEERGIDLPSMLGYSDTKDKVTISEMIRSNWIAWDLIPRGQEKEFDIAVFRILGHPMHVGVVVKRGLMIHCERGSNTYLTNYYKEHQWDKRLEGFFRYANRPSIAPSVSPS